MKVFFNKKTGEIEKIEFEILEGDCKKLAQKFSEELSSKGIKIEISHYVPESTATSAGKSSSELTERVTRIELDQ